MHSTNSYKNFLLSWNKEVDNNQLSILEEPNLIRYLFTIIMKPDSYDKMSLFQILC